MPDLSDRKVLQAFCDALIARSGATVPEGYDVEAAFGDVLTIGACTHDPVAQQPIARLALWLFARLPGGKAEL